MSAESITIIAVGATIVLVIVGLATLFYTMFSGRLEGLERQIGEIKSEMRDMKSDLQGQISGVQQGLQREMGEMKEGLQREMGEIKSEMGDIRKAMQHETSRIWESIDAMRAAHQTLSDRVSTLSDRVNQVIVSTGAVVKDSGASYKKGKGATPAAKPKGGSKKSG